MDEWQSGPGVLEGEGAGHGQPVPEENWVLAAKASLQPKVAASRPLLLPHWASTNYGLSPGSCLGALLLATHLGMPLEIEPRRMVWRPQVEMETSQGRPHSRCSGSRGVWDWLPGVPGSWTDLRSLRHLPGPRQGLKSCDVITTRYEGQPCFIRLSMCQGVPAFHGSPGGQR